MAKLRTINTAYFLANGAGQVGRASSNSPSFNNLAPLTGTDPSEIINPNKIGSKFPSKSPVGLYLKDKGIANGQLDLTDPKQLVFIGETNGANKRYINPKTQKPEYMLFPSAANAWYKWRDAMKAQGVKFRMSSAYRNYSHQTGLGGGSTVAKAGTSAHGIGIAIDFGNLVSIVNGSGSPNINARGRRTQQYQDIAKIGVNYGWYNPWRLADARGKVDEIWHFEYWGPV
jgi:hypothetical protein